MKKIRAPIKQKLEYILPVVIAIAILSVIIAINGDDHSGVSAAGMHGLTGTGQSSNHVIVSNFPTLTSLSQMGVTSANLVKDVSHSNSSKGNQPSISGNQITLTTAPTYNNADGYNYTGTTKTSAKGRVSAVSPMKINMKQSWELKFSIIIPKSPEKSSAAFGAVWLDNGSKAQGFMMRNAKVEGYDNFARIEWCTINSSNHSRTSSSNLQTITFNEFAVTQNTTVSYNAATGKLHIDYGGKTADSPMNSSNMFVSNKTNANLGFTIEHTYDSGKNDGTYGRINFQSFRYTDYTREITTTELQDSAGRKITGPVGSGHTITVKHNLKGVKDNKFSNFGHAASDNID